MSRWRLRFPIYKSLAIMVGMLPVSSGALAPPGESRQSSDKILAEARQAARSDAWQSIARMRLQGRYSAGDEPGSFVQIVDVRSGNNRINVTSGSLENINGFDGVAWTSQNGIVTLIDLPALAADARTRAFLLREGWRDPSTHNSLATTACPASAKCVTFKVAQGSPVTIWFDRRSHLPSKAVMETDDGVETTTYADWRRVGGVRLAYRRVSSDKTGATTTLSVINASATGIAASALARPVPRAHGILMGGTSAHVAFKFTALDRGHIVVTAIIDGHSANVLFDSGGANYFTPDTARMLGLKVAGGVNIGGVGGGTELGGFAHVDSITIGGATLSNEAAIVGPLPYPALRPRAGLVVSGLTGYEFLAEFRTTIDYAARTLSFASFDDPAPRGGVTIPFYSDEHSIYVEANIEGVTGMFRLDTGDGGALTVFRRFADRHGLFKRGGYRSLQAGGVGGAITAREMIGQKFGLAGSMMRGVPVSISDTKSGAFFSRSLAGNLGSAVLARFAIIFDYRARTVTFIPNAQLNAPYPHDRTGLSLSQVDSSSLLVLSVAAGSPAARAGVLPGDKIVIVDARSVRANMLGVFDLTPLRYGNAPFSLKLERAGQTLDVTITPMSF